MLKIPLVDVRAQYQALRPVIETAVQRVLARGQYILGPEVEALERELAAYCGTAHAVAVASGTDALELSLRACRIGPGDEVITTAFSFFATVEAILQVGAVPVFVDIDPVTYAIDVTQIEGKMTGKTKAILPVHLFGHPAAMVDVLDVARAHHVKVIEDCAQAIGASLDDKQVGSFGDAGCLSFYPSKNLGAFGDGGMVVTNDAAIAEQVRLLRAHGEVRRGHHVTVGRNSRLDELQAAVLRVKLPHLDQWNEDRRRHAHDFAKAFTAEGLGMVGLPQERPGCRHVYHLYSVRVPGRDRVRQVLAQHGIASEVYYPEILPFQPALVSTMVSRDAYPTAQAVCRDVLALPMYPELPSASVTNVVRVVAKALQSPPEHRSKTP